MDVTDWLISLRRRWIVSTIMILVTAGAVFGVAQLVAPRYESGASLVLLGPSSYVDQDGEDVRINPYAQFGGSGEGITATTLVAVLMSPQALREARLEGFPGEYEIAFSPLGGGAILDFTVTSDSPEESLEGLEIILTRAQDMLIQRQVDAGAPERSLVRASVLTRSEEAESLNGARVRAAGATGVLGIALTFLVARGLDLRRTRRLVRAAAPRSSRSHVAGAEIDDRAAEADQVGEAVLEDAPKPDEAPDGPAAAQDEDVPDRSNAPEEVPASDQSGDRPSGSSADDREPDAGDDSPSDQHDPTVVPTQPSSPGRYPTVQDRDFASVVAGTSRDDDKRSP